MIESSLLEVDMQRHSSINRLPLYPIALSLAFLIGLHLSHPLVARQQAFCVCMRMCVRSHVAVAMSGFCLSERRKI